RRAAQEAALLRATPARPSAAGPATQRHGPVPLSTSRQLPSDMRATFSNSWCVPVSPHGVAPAPGRIHTMAANSIVALGADPTEFGADSLNLCQQLTISQ
ncbi:MAG: hypothetical protein WCK34_15355, partial [Bacteroidota bacterium]